MKYELFKILDEQSKATVLSLFNEYTKLAKDATVDYGSFKVIATSDDVDRDGEIIDVNGWDFKNYETNPVVLWGHDFTSMPIGKVTKLTRDGNKIIAEGVFAPTERGQEVRKAYEGEFLNTVSVGFIPRERKGNTITKSELLELSFVPVPANANAVALRAVEELSVKMMGKAADPVSAEPVAPVEAEKETKGIIADVVDAQENADEMTWNEKYGRMCEVSGILGALWDVYFRPETMVDDFDSLLKESIDLLNGLLGSRVQTEGIVAQNIKSIDDKSLANAILANFEQKSGRVLSKKNRDLITTAAKALQDLLDSTDATDEEKALEPQDQPAEADESTAQSQDADTKALMAAVLRGIDQAVGKNLRDLKRGK